MREPAIRIGATVMQTVMDDGEPRQARRAVWWVSAPELSCPATRGQDEAAERLLPLEGSVASCLAAEQTEKTAEPS